MSSTMHQIKTEVYRITSENVKDKLSSHFNEIIEYITLMKLSNIKINTRIEGITINIDIIEMGLREELKKK